jgi:hypothetical protein
VIGYEEKYGHKGYARERKIVWKVVRGIELPLYLTGAWERAVVR